MARYGCTITVATGKMPSSQSNFTWLATQDNFPTAAIDGGSTSILNGGGNLRCYTDDTKTTQLPIEVVTFVTGVTPEVRVWGLSSTLNVASTVYIEADTVATTQPVVTDTYGRNSVWVDYEFATRDGVTDLTGNHTPTLSGVTVGSEVPPTGEATLDFGGVSDTAYIEATIGSLTTYTLKAWFYPTAVDSSGNDCIILQDATLASTAQSSLLMDKSPNDVGMFNTPSSWLRSSVSTALNAWSYISSSSNGSTRKININGTEAATSAIGGEGSRTLLRVGSRFPSLTTWLYSGEMSLVAVDKRSNTADYAESEFNNQNDPSTFWTVGAWEDQDAGGPTPTITPFYFTNLLASN